MPASSSADHAIATLGGRSMGTTWSVKLIAPRGRDLHPLHACIQAALDRVVAQMAPGKRIRTSAATTALPLVSGRPYLMNFMQC